MEFLREFGHSLISTAGDMLPIVVIIFGFQLVVIRRRIPNLKRVLIGFFYVLLGLSLFLMGLEQAIFPLGEQMATQLSDPQFIAQSSGHSAAELYWYDYYWVYLFAATIGFSTTIAEPSLRIVTGIPLYYFIVVGYVVVMIQTYFSPKFIIALAYDSGGVTTSTVTVPLVAALGLGLANSVPGRSALLDGFGLIAFASLLPIIAVLGYVQLSEWMVRRSIDKESSS